MALRENNWDDYGFRTLFGVEIFLPGGTSLDLGAVKIMQRGQESGYTALPGREFAKLDESYCSLGQDADYYEKLLSLPSDIRDDYLRSVRDAAADPTVREEFKGEDAWKTSLLRFGQAGDALVRGAELLVGERRRTGVAGFTYKRPNRGLTVQFKFDDTGPLPGRCNVLIGYNGVGKTRLLADIAKAASQVASQDTEVALSGRDTTFGALVAVSYSAFDDFELPEDQTADQDDDFFEFEAGRTDLFGYVYCGLRRTGAKDTGRAEPRRRELKSLDEIDHEFVTAFGTARDREGQALADALRTLELEPSFGRIGVEPSQWLLEPALAEQEIGQLSTGHKIVLNILVQLSAHLKPRALVLLDEPETHLHPPLLAALLKAIQLLLDAYDSFAIIATHSPVVLQEVPSAFVRVLSRFGNDADVEEAEIETFGETVGAITRYVFNLDNSATDYQGVLADLAATRSLEEIEELFALGLSDQARALVLRAQRHGRGRAD